MDKRFFIALFLSLVVVAVAQLLFPPANTTPGSRLSPAGDSSMRLKNAGVSAAASSSLPNANPATALLVTRMVPAATQGAGQAVVATTPVNTPRAVYNSPKIV